MKSVIICACKTGEKVNSEKLNELLTTFDKQNIAYTLFDDLCGYAAKNKSLDSKLHNELSVFGCQPKALKNILPRVGIDTNTIKAEYLPVENVSSDWIASRTLSQGTKQQIEYTDEWKPWYPVIDYSLCTDCKKCMNFCLFGVYKLSDGKKVQVENPENCKDLCPACARTCSANAIVFPKHHESPIDGGQKNTQPDSHNLLDDVQQNSDVYKLLADRRKASGIPLFKNNQLKIAEEERKQCSCKK